MDGKIRSNDSRVVIAFAALSMLLAGCASDTDGRGKAEDGGTANNGTGGGGAGGGQGGGGPGGTRSNGGDGGHGGSRTDGGGGSAGSRSRTSLDAGGAEDADSGGTCFRSADTSTPECAYLELCTRSAPIIDVSPDNCGGGPCSWTFQEDLGDTLTFENDQGWIFLRFAGGTLRNAHTTADLLAAFQHVNFYAKYVVHADAPRDGAVFPALSTARQAIYFETRQRSDSLDTFTLEAGRLHLRLSFTITAPYTTLLSKTAICGDTNLCVCTFSGVEQSTTFDVDLPMPSFGP